MNQVSPGFSYSVVLKEHARIRIQIFADHEKWYLDKTSDTFTNVDKKYGILGKKKDEIIEITGFN